MNELKTVLTDCVKQGIAFKEIERSYFESALGASNYDAQAASKKLGMKPNLVNKKINQYGIKRKIKPRGKCIQLEMLSLFGRMLRQAREKKNYALKTVAYEMGYKSATYISKLELGLRQPSKNLIEKLSRVLDVDPMELEKASQASRSAVTHD